MCPLEALLHNIDVGRRLGAEQDDLVAAYTDIVRNEQGATELRQLSEELTDLEAG